MHILLSMYQKPANTGQIYNVTIGRSTPTILYLTEVNGWKVYYGTLPGLKRNQVEACQKIFLKQGWLKPTPHEDKFIVSKQGQTQLDQYFADHSSLRDQGTFLTFPFYHYFWQMVQFMTQVVSEKSYANKHYLPLKSDLKSQIFVKSVKSSVQDFEASWMKEQGLLLSQVQDQAARILANTLTGHDLFGLTLDQLARFLSWEKGEIYWVFHQACAYYLSLLDQEGQSFPLHRKLLNYTNQVQTYGLTQSAYQTFRLMVKRKSLDQIAQIKGVKLGTIKEHYLEIAFKLPQVELTYLVPDQIRRELLDFFAQNPTPRYAQAKDQLGELEFYHYRLIELELIRQWPWIYKLY